MISIFTCTEAFIRWSMTRKCTHHRAHNCKICSVFFIFCCFCNYIFKRREMWKFENILFSYSYVISCATKNPTHTQHTNQKYITRAIWDDLNVEVFLFSCSFRLVKQIVIKLLSWAKYTWDKRFHVMPSLETFWIT